MTTKFRKNSRLPFSEIRRDRHPLADSLARPSRYPAARPIPTLIECNGQRGSGRTRAADALKKHRFRGDKPVNNGDNPRLSAPSRICLNCPWKNRP
jgi:hypothetical protein